MASATRHQVVEDLPPGDRRAQHDVGNGRADGHVDERRQPAVEERVPDHLLGVREHGGEVRQRELLGQHGEAPHLGERQQQDSQVRGEHEEEHRGDPAVGEHRLPGAEAPLGRLHAAARDERVVAPLHEPPRAAHRRDGEGHQDHADHVADRVLEPDGSHAQVRLRGQHVGDVEHQRRAQVVEDLDEGERRAGDVSRHREREDHLAEEPPAGSAEVLRRFLHGRIDVGERGGEIQQDEREVVQRLHEDHAVEPVHERQRRRRRRP